MRTCGTWCTWCHTSVETGLPDSAAHVGAPTNSSAAAVGTTVTSCPDSVRRRSSSQALYAAMPPATPRTTRGRLPSGDAASVVVLVLSGSLAVGEGGVGGAGLGSGLLGGELGRVDVLAGQQVVVDLAQRDRERLLLHVGVDERADVLEQALAQLGVVGVDLASTLGAGEHQLVLAVGLAEQVVDRGVGDALGGDGGRSHGDGASQCS